MWVSGSAICRIRSMRATALGTVRHICCASPSYLERAGVPREPMALVEHSCITFTSFSQPDRWTFPGRKSQNIPVQPRLIVNTAEAAIDAAKAGLGIVRVLSYQAQESSEGRCASIDSRLVRARPHPCQPDP